MKRPHLKHQNIKETITIGLIKLKDFMALKLATIHKKIQIELKTEIQNGSKENISCFSACVPRNDNKGISEKV